MVKLTKIYTKTGDDGSTGLVTGARRSKTDPRIEAIGDVDELNSVIGMARESDGLPPEIASVLARVQNELFDLGADLATDEDIADALRSTAEQVLALETEIDRLNDGLAPLTSFILPAGSPAIAALHFARAVTRRAERRVWALADADAGYVNVETARYLNRLSDYLFVAARRLGVESGREVLWQPGGQI